MVWLHRTPFTLFNDLDRLASAAVQRMAAVWPEAAVDAPRANVHLTDGEAGVELLVPGYGPEHVTVSVERNRVTIQGERKEGDGEAARTVARFERRIELPFVVDADRVQAKLEYGVLRLALPRHATAAARVIPVR